MLVLLIIFMVAAPLATVDIKVDLPASTAKPSPRPEKPVFLSVKADQRLFLGEDEVKAETLGATLDAKTQGKKDTTIFFQADKGVDYGDLDERDGRTARRRLPEGRSGRTRETAP